MDITVVSTTTLVLNDSEVEVVVKSLRESRITKAFSVEQDRIANQMVDALDPDVF